MKLMTVTSTWSYIFHVVIILWDFCFNRWINETMFFSVLGPRITSCQRLVILTTHQEHLLVLESHQLQQTKVEIIVNNFIAVNSGCPVKANHLFMLKILGQHTLAQQESSINNNLFIDVDFEGGDDTMGDLQSPQYVKRTAHMFDSRFSSEVSFKNFKKLEVIMTVF